MSELVHGRHAVFHLIQAKRRKVDRLHLLKSLEKEEAPLIQLARSQKIPVSFADPAFFTNKLGSATHQGVVAETSAYPYVRFDEVAGESFVLLLDEIQDPQNLGALCRSAYLLGVQGIIIPENRSASVTAGACQASVGAVEYLKIARVSSIASALEILKENQFWIYGADMQGTKILHEEKFPPKVALVIGSEERGLRKLVRERCDILLKIPTMKAEVDSLNASVAGGILMYEIFRQQGKTLAQ